MNIGNAGPDITHEHPEYAAKRAMWRQYRDLYAGGAAVHWQTLISTWCGVRKSRAMFMSSG